MGSDSLRRCLGSDLGCDQINIGGFNLLEDIMNWKYKKLLIKIRQKLGLNGFLIQGIRFYTYKYPYCVPMQGYNPIPYIYRKYMEKKEFRKRSPKCL